MGNACTEARDSVHVDVGNACTEARDSVNTDVGNVCTEGRDSLNCEHTHMWRFVMASEDEPELPSVSAASPSAEKFVMASEDEPELPSVSAASPSAEKFVMASQDEPELPSGSAPSHSASQASSHVWLASCPMGARRFHFNEVRSRCLLPQEPWLLTRCQQHGVQIETPDYVRIPDISLCALLELEAGQEARVLSQMTPEMDVLWRYWKCPRDAYSLLIKSVLPVVSGPHRLLLQKRRSDKMGSHSEGLDSKVVSIKLGKVGYIWLAHDLENVTLSVQGNPQAMSEVLQELGFGSVGGAELPVILLPHPLPFLVCCRAWSTVLHQARWSWHMFPGWPDPAWVAETCGQYTHSADTPDTLLSLHDVHSLAQDLRRWSHSILAGVCVCV